ncbi:Yip1 family protein [Natrinema sp. LN54]|uniref:Yip1 family protein n=1 Tax=Natrinema sp. LN54 TaxID=3458705 RepID=UPI004035C637
MPPRTPLFDPGGYFSARENARRDGLLAFALFGAANLVFIYAVVRLVFDQVTGLPQGVRSQAFSIVIPMTAFSLVIAWLVVAAVMHWLGGSGSSTGTFGDALAVAGWAYVPDLLGLPLKYLFARSKIESLSIDATDPSQFAAEVEAVQAELGLAVVPLLVQVVAVGWSVYVLAGGTAETHDVSLESAAGAAALIGIGSVTLTLLNGL